MGEDQDLEKVSRKFVHDIRTPISVLSMLTNMFESGQVGPEDLSIMKEEVGKMEKMVAEHSDKMKKFYERSVVNSQ